jgi:cytochrome c oxidase subunit 2
VLAASFGLFAVAPLVNWWLPVRVSSFAWDVDFLFYVILGFTTFFFLLTEAILVYAMWRFAHAPGRRATYVEGSHRLEMAWTIVPAVILLYIAFAQVKTWEEIKYASRTPPPDLVIQVSARQWEWRMRYSPDVLPKKARESDADPARTWAEAPQIDDITLPNEVHTWKGANVKAFLKTQDVIHSFFLPHLRLKQDALPGKTIPIWFNATEWNVRFERDFDKPSGGWRELPVERDYELACAELCGGGHYRMRGRLFVHENEDDYKAWLAYVKERQGSHKPEDPALAARNGEK